jgi:hypothetical protein
MRLIREAKLEDQFNGLYPRVPAKIWIPASDLLRR